MYVYAACCIVLDIQSACSNEVFISAHSLLMILYNRDCRRSFTPPTHWLVRLSANTPVCGSVAEWLGRWTCDQQVMGSNPSRPAVECNPGQVVYTHVPLSPSSIIWYQPMGGDAWQLGR